MPMRTACYARFSSDLQKPTSLDDQIYGCRMYAERQGWTWQDAHIYTDAGISGASIEGRLGLQRLLTAADATPRSFDVVIVDDSSRLSRDAADALRTVQRLTFARVRVIFVSQGIDTANEQSELLVGFHGLIDQLHLTRWATRSGSGSAEHPGGGSRTAGGTSGTRTVPSPIPRAAGEPLAIGLRSAPPEGLVCRRVFSGKAKVARLQPFWRSSMSP